MPAGALNRILSAHLSCAAGALPSGSTGLHRRESLKAMDACSSASLSHCLCGSRTLPHAATYIAGAASRTCSAGRHCGGLWSPHRLCDEFGLKGGGRRWPAEQGSMLMSSGAGLMLGQGVDMRAW